MGNFLGGSAWAMAKDISEGFVLVTDRSFVRLGGPELDALAFELDRRLRELRGEQPASDDTVALQQRNRRILRLNSALAMLRAYRQKGRR